MALFNVPLLVGFGKVLHGVHEGLMLSGKGLKGCDDLGEPVRWGRGLVSRERRGWERR